MTEKDTRYRDLLARQLAMNEQTLATLRRHGLGPDTEVRLDFAYRAPNRRAAEGLKQLLAEQTDYEAAVKSDGGILRKRWSVVGRTQQTVVSSSILDQWVTWMVTAGLERECEFDGWGADI